MSEWFTFEAGEVDELQARMKSFGAGAGQVVDGVLHGEGAQEIKREIKPLIHASGRTWPGKRSSATSANPFTQENGQLSVTIVSRGAYHYLYFPDDGSNTVRHVGNQQFMMRGAENASERIIDLCTEKLIDKLEG